MKENGEIKVKSLQKAIEVLNCFTKKNSLGVTEISSMLGLYKSNVHSILTTYKSMDYLEQDEESGKYRLGLGIFSLCRALGDRFSIKQVAMPYLQEIANLTNERVYLAIPNEDEVIYLEAMYPAESVNLMRTIMGESAKMYCTGIGKAILAHLPIDEIEEYISRELVAYTEMTITDKDKLKEELQLIRVRGYAIDNMEHEYGIKCIAMPIFNRQGKVEASISISGPSLRFENERIEELAQILGKYIKKIQERL
ncbi:transcriptional regulator [Sporanaerobium hydrogeniformans]|uniref:Transcriptional regulator n=1 Tax=Sporanaerobium hydrogeniformans TaxID=3072179 RepID=A0AC61DBE6_9FIRM|nr:IclR family transcriptional regulator [Sporanaerobium hydrogeniformans]PHV70235.1 transcriptional regulator [Sporanaerobium hydrogeniformans]